MKPRDLLKLGLQLVGVFFLYQTANMFVELITALFVGMKPATGLFLQLLLRLVAALYFLRGAPPFLSWAERDDHPKP